MALLTIGIVLAGAVVAAFALTRGIICDDPAVQSNPSTDGSFAVWEDQRAGDGADIWGRDLDGSEERVISDAEGEQRSPVVSGDVVAWADERNNPGSNEYDIYALDLSTGAESPVSTEEGTQVNPDVSGSLVVWQDHRNGDADIYVRDLATGIESEVSTATGDQTDPAISGTLVVWVDRRSGEGEIFVRDLASSEPETRVADIGETQWSPDVEGNRIAWIAGDGSGGSVVYLQTLGGPAQAIESRNAFIDDVSISDRLVVWFLDEAQGWVKGYDLATGDLLDLAGGPRNFVNQPHVGDGVVVWSDYGDEDRADIYGIALEIDDQTPPETSLEGLSDGEIAENEPLGLDAVDPGIFVSGVAETRYRLDDAPETTYTEALFPELGEHRIVYWSVDASGNVEPVNEASFTVVAQEEDDSADENATRSLPTTGSDAFVLLPLAGVFAVLGGALRRRAHR